MKRKLKSIITAALCAVGLAAAAGLVPVEYLDWDDVGKEMTNAVCTAYTVVTADMTAFDAGKTYVVMDDVSVSSCITVNGTAANPTRLILCDGAKLTAQGGVKVTVSGATTNALVICGQVNGTGALEATGGLRTAGIGGLSNDTQPAGSESGIGGMVTINGGAVTATGGNCGAGIGGGWGGAGGTVTINGGAVTATGGDCAAGIGGGYGGAGGNVSINGGTVTATGGDTGAGIGKGAESSDDNGTVTFGAGEWIVKQGDAAPGTDTTVEAYAADHSAKYVHIEIPEPEISALSNEFALDLTAGDRIAADEEPIVVDPAWGDASEAQVQIDGESSARAYTSAGVDTWDTTGLEPGRYGLLFTAGSDEATAAFWKLGTGWVVFDSSNITADVTFEAGKTYLILGTNTANSANLMVADGAKFFYGEGVPSGFKGGTVTMSKRYETKTVGDLYQIVERIKGCADNPWVVGVGVEAYTNGTELVIVGAGTITDLSEIPTGVKGGITTITINAGVTDAAAGVFYGFDKVTVTLPDNWQGELPDERDTWCGATGATLTRVPMAVKNVKVQQRYPWNGKVDVDFDLTGEGAVKVTLSARVDGKKLRNPTVTGGTTFDLGDGKELKDLRLTWDAKADFGDEALHEKIKVKLSLAPAEPD